MSRDIERIEELIKEKLPEDVFIINRLLEANGFKCFVVGGALRDLAISLIWKCDVKISDWDIVTDASSEDIVRIFSKRIRVCGNKGFIVSRIGTTKLLIPRLGTTEVKFGSKSYELTPIKGEEVFTMNILNRDITANAMLYSITDNKLFFEYNLGEEYINCIEDIKERSVKLIAAIFKQSEFNRMNLFRAIRVAICLDFNINKQSAYFIKKNEEVFKEENKGKLNKEIKKVIMTQASLDFSDILDNKLLHSFCEGFDEVDIVDFFQCFRYIKKYDTLNQRLSILYLLTKNKELFEVFLTRLGISKQDIAIAKTLNSIL